MAFQPTNLGYDTNATKKSTPVGANGLLTFPKLESKSLWIYEVNSTFGMAGSKAQSYRTRSFFPRNFIQPSFMVSCQFPNQETYADVVEFIRNTQTLLDSSLRLYITPRRMGVKGLSEPFEAEGYIKSVSRSHERFVYAPELQFEFIIENQVFPVAWRDTKVQSPRKLRSWKEIIEQKKPGFLRDPDPKPEERPYTPPPHAPGPNGESRPG